MTKVWRINIKTAASEGVDPRIFCIKNNILGIGWQVDYDGEINWDIYNNLATEEYYNQGDNGWWPAINAIKNRMKINDLCWTRDWNGVYYLGQIVSDWSYIRDKANCEADVVNVRKCNWVKVGAVDAVPGKIVNSFIPPRVVQAVQGESVLLYSQYLYNALSSQQHYNLPSITVDLFELISSEDCEDLVGIYLQDQGYRVIPSSCKDDTASYEFVLKNSKTGDSAVTQVKQGHVNLRTDNYETFTGNVYLFTSHGNYIGKSLKNVFTISPEDLKVFAFENRHTLSDRLKTWISIIEELSTGVS